MPLESRFWFSTTVTTPAALTWYAPPTVKYAPPFAIGHHVVQAAEGLAVGEAAGEHAVLGQQLCHVGEFLAALVEGPRGIRAGALHAEEPARRIERDRARGVRVAQHHVFLVGGIELADRVGLLLREHHAAVGRGDDAVGGLRNPPTPVPTAHSRRRRRESRAPRRRARRRAASALSAHAQPAPAAPAAPRPARARTAITRPPDARPLRPAPAADCPAARR